jgi:hypothetical protein
LCNRNDKAQKVSGLILNHSDQLFPYLSKPILPSYRLETTNGCARIFFTLPFFSLIVICIVSSITSGPDIGGVIIFIISSIAGSLIFSPWIIRNQEAKERYKENIERLNKYEIPAHKIAIDKWNKLYYCTRDDCVYIPGSSFSVPSSDAQEYLFKDENV